MKLTSADVAEVIRRRLLQKNEAGIDAAHRRLRASSTTTSRRSSTSATARQPTATSADREDFVDSYPFVPYQFALFQSAIRGLSEHNAFEGKHRSVGERSMLAVFQQVAMRMDDRPRRRSWRPST